MAQAMSLRMSLLARNDSLTDPPNRVLINAPLAGLTMGAGGNLFGTTNSGGAGGDGTVFEISASGTESILYSFSVGTDGAYPDAPLAIDSAGNLYGMTYEGGANGDGVVFKLTYGFDGVTVNYTKSSLYSFRGGADGINPDSPLIIDGSGNLYGTTGSGGAANSGVVFRIAPNGAESILYTFSGAADGGDPAGGLIMDSAGALYGTTQRGGVFGYGTVFKLTPRSNSSYTETVLYSFSGGLDGADPLGGLIMDSAGNLYGTTLQGGVGGYGEIFEIKAQ